MTTNPGDTDGADKVAADEKAQKEHDRTEKMSETEKVSV